MTCPKEKWCTESIKVASTELSSFRIDDRKFIGNMLCQYMIKFSVDSRPGDKVQVEVTGARNVKMYGAKGEGPR